MVSKIPSTCNLGLSWRFTFPMVESSCSKPFAGKYSDWTGMIIRSAAAKAFTVSIPKDGWQSIRIWEYCSFILSRYWRRMLSRLMAFTSETSIPDSWILAGIKSTPSGWWRIPSPCGIGSSIRICPIASERVNGSWSGCGYPRLIVKLPCGSASTNNTFLPSLASPIPKFVQVVVLPTPPFWFAIAIICAVIVWTPSLYIFGSIKTAFCLIFGFKL